MAGLTPCHSSTKLFNGAARSVCCRCAYAFPHHADEDVIVDRDLAVNHVLWHAEVWVRMGFVSNEFQYQTLFRRQERKHIIDVPDQPCQSIAFFDNVAW